MRLSRVVLALAMGTAAQAAAQGEPPPPHPRFMIRLGWAAVTANGTKEFQSGIHLAPGIWLSREVALVAQFLQHTGPSYPPETNRPIHTRRFLLGGIEWSPRATDLETLGDLRGTLRLNGGGVFREALDPGSAVGLGFNLRFALTRWLAGVIDLQGLMTILPDDPVERCPAPYYTAGCNPFAAAGNERAEGFATLMLEARW